MEQSRHELFEELDAFDPQWQTRYPYIRAAAIAANAEELFNDWLQTPQGTKYRRDVAAAHNHMADNKERRALRQAEIDMARRAGL